MAKSHDELLDAIGSMSVLELVEFSKAFQDKFNVTAAMMSVAAPAAATTEAAAAPKEEAKAEYKVELVEAGPEKMKTIKAIRSVSVGGAQMPLTDAKTKAESAPVELFAAVPKEEAEKLKKALEEVGAKVKLS